MQKPALPLDEALRVENVRALCLLDTPAEERFDRVTRLARRLFDAPVAAISLIDSTRQWFKSSQGMDLTQISRDISFCGHTILEDGPMIVEDATRDPRFADNPLVVGDPRFRFYAGCPLRASDGSVLGTLLVFDFRPRTFRDEDLSNLTDLAGIAESELSISRSSPAQREVLEDTSVSPEERIDALTRLWNRLAILEILDRELVHARRSGRSVGVLFADIDHLKQVNDRLGHEAGDEVLREVGRRIRATVRPYDAVGRYGGEEILVVLPEADSENSRQAAERIRVNVAGTPLDAAGGTPVSISIGVAGRDQAGLDARALLSAAERALYRAKVGGGNRTQVARQGEGA